MKKKTDLHSISDLLYDIKKNLNITSKKEPFEKKWEAQKFLFNLLEKNYIPDLISSLLYSNDNELKFFGLQLLERLISYNWKNLPEYEKRCTINLIFEFIYNINPSTSSAEELFYNKKLKCCMVKLVLQSEIAEILSFLRNLIEQASSSTLFFKKNFDLIYILFDEILLEQNNILRHSIEKEDTFLNLLKKIENLCQCILEKTGCLLKENSNLLIACLNCLEITVKISPDEYCFEEHLFTLLILICPNSKIMNFSLNCLTELVSHENKSESQLPTKIFINFIVQFQELLPLSYNIAELYKIFSQENKQFILNTILFIIATFQKKSNLLDLENLSLSSFYFTNQLIVKFSCIPSIEIYNLCLNWWIQVVKNNASFYSNSIVNESMEKVFTDLRIILTCRMAKPEEVLIREDEHGQLLRENIYDTEAFDIYKKSKELFIFLAELNKENTKDIILGKLVQQFKPHNWNFTVLNSICWAIGSISDIFTPDWENSKLFFVTVLKNLLYLCELKKEKKTKL